ACKNGHSASVKRLIGDPILTINAQDNDGWTALHYATLSGYEEIILLLLKNNARLIAEDADGHTPLDYAASEGHDVAVRILLESKKIREEIDKDKVLALAKESLGSQAFSHKRKELETIIGLIEGCKEQAASAKLAAS